MKISAANSIFAPPGNRTALPDRAANDSAPPNDGRDGSPRAGKSDDGPVRGTGAATPPLDLAGQSAAQGVEEDASPEAESNKKDGEEKGPDGLTEEERQEVEKLKKRDREVRAHEQAHKAAGGPHAGQPTYETETGPDGRAYAVSGEVKIDTSEVPNNPQATIRKMETVKRAALAPSQPSATDRQVAAQAEAKARKARLELREQKAEETAAKNDRRADGTNGADGENAADPTQPPTGQPANRTPSIGAQGRTLDPGSLFDLTA